MSGKACGGEDRLLAEVHPPHKLFSGKQGEGGRLIFCRCCGMHSEARRTNLENLCDPTKVNVTRLGNLTKGMHPATGIPFDSVHLVHATGCGPAGPEEVLAVERSMRATAAPLLQPARPYMAAQHVVLGLDELSRLEAEYEAALALPEFAPVSPEQFEDDEVVFD